MGQNRRYGSDLNRATIPDSVLRSTPVSLGKVEVGEKVTQTTDPPRVVAWIPFRLEQTAVPVDGRVIAYTDTACEIEFTTRTGQTHQVWVWRGAVRAEKPREQRHQLAAADERVRAHTGEWWLRDPDQVPYAILKLPRRGDEVGYRAVTYAERSADRELIGYYRKLVPAAAAAHERHLHSLTSPTRRTR